MRRRRKNTSNGPYWKGEVCENPWDENCEKGDVVVYIDHKKGRKPICRSCWRKLAISENEWG